MTKPFEGFPHPEQNWSKLPHVLIDQLPVFVGKSELAVVLYILRHTWGYEEFDEGKRITIDEFANGRKRRDGSRMDKGVGMSRGIIHTALQKAEEHGFIECETDDSDKGRIKKTYKLRMSSVQLTERRVQPNEHRGQKVDPRTEKETIETNSGKNGATRPRNPLFDAVLEACYGFKAESEEGKAIAKKNGSVIGKAAAAAKLTGKSEDDIRREVRAWIDWAGSPPLPGQLEGKLLQQAPGKNGSRQSEADLQATVEELDRLEAGE